MIPTTSGTSDSSPPSSLRLFKKIITHASLNSFALSTDVFTTIAPLVVFGRQNSKYNSAAQLVNILYLTVVLLRQYALILNGRMTQDKEKNTKIFNQVSFFNHLASVATVAVLLSGAYGGLTIDNLNLDSTAVKLTQEFLILGTPAAVLHLYDRTYQTFVASTAKKDIDYPSTALGLQRKLIPSVITGLSFILGIAFTLCLNQPSSPYAMSAAYLLSKTFSVSAYKLFFYCTGAFSDNSSTGCLSYDPQINREFSKRGATLIGALALEIMFPVLQSFLVAKRSNNDLALYGITSFIFNILYVVGLGLNNGAKIAITSYKDDSVSFKRASAITIASITSITALLLLPLIVAPNQTLQLFAKDTSLVDDAKKLIAPLAIWILSSSLANGTTAALRAGTTKQSPLIYPRLITQWGLNLGVSLYLAFGRESSVGNYVWSNAITNCLYAMLLSLELLQLNRQSAQTNTCTIQLA